MLHLQVLAQVICAIAETFTPISLSYWFPQRHVPRFAQSYSQSAVTTLLCVYECTRTRAPEVGMNTSAWPRALLDKSPAVTEESLTLFSWATSGAPRVVKGFSPQPVLSLLLHSRRSHLESATPRGPLVALKLSGKGCGVAHDL